MEGVIAGLLKDFEDGKMNRRQLIRSLATVAIAGPAAVVGAQTRGQTPPGSTDARVVPPTQAPSQTEFGKAPWKTVWLDHISYAVSDYKRSTEFYTNLMGWTVRNENGNSQATLDINGIGGIIIRNGRLSVTPAPGRGDAPPRPPITGVINHVSWGVQPWDTDKVKAELERRGLKPSPDMVGENFKSFHVKDPDGWDLQISNQTKDSRGNGGA